MAELVNFQISNSISQYGSEKRFAKDILISDLKVNVFFIVIYVSLFVIYTLWVKVPEDC